MEDPITFDSEGLALSGLLSVPADAKGRAPAVVIMHGFGGHKDGPQQRWSQPFYAGLGYATLRFDFRGCGESEGPRGFVLPYGQVADARAAIDYLAARPDIDPDRIVLSGTSYGASVAVYAAGIDERVAAVIAQGGWANGEHMFRSIHDTPEKWAAFSEMLLKGRSRKDSEPHEFAHRFDMIPIPERLRSNIDGSSHMEFALDTAVETLAFNAGDVADRIAPRPLCLIHSAKDEVITADGSIELFKAAGYHGDLHVVSGVDHFMFGENDNRVENIVRDFLKKSFAD